MSKLEVSQSAIHEDRGNNKERQMEIPIKIGNRDFVITSDINQYIIAEPKVKDGKPYLEGRWFYSSLGSLLAALLNKKVRASDAETLAELRDAIYQAEREILSAFDSEIQGNDMDRKILERIAS